MSMSERLRKYCSTCGVSLFKDDRGWEYCPYCEQAIKFQDQLASLRAALSRAEAAEGKVCFLKTEFQHIAEYWNRDQNETAMADALWHIIEVAEAAALTLTTPCSHAEDAKRAGDGVSRIAAERIRQKSVEGWTPEHDEQHGFGELSIAAACYALNCRKEDGSPIEGDAVVHDRDCHDGWPWSRKWDKRGKHSRERSLEIAGALIAAELDRIAALREVGK